MSDMSIYLLTVIVSVISSLIGRRAGYAKGLMDCHDMLETYGPEAGRLRNAIACKLRLMRDP